MFRYERPQKGRQRQFHQFDVEALGFEGPDVDAEQIVLLARLWKRLGIADVELHVNSIGDAADRKAHREKLIAYFEKHAAVAGRGREAPPAHQSAAHPRLQESRDAGHDRGRAALWTILGSAARGALRGTQGAARDAGSRIA
jgi:histidyl-tRNA synthetase